MRPELETLSPVLFGKTYAKKILGTQFSNLVGVWPYSELTGHRCNNLITAEVSGEVVVNGGFEVLSGGGEIFGEWSERAGTGGIAEEGVIIHGGARSLKLTRGADDNTWVWQYMRVEPGETYSISFWSYANGGAASRYGIKDDTAGNWITALGTSTGNAAAAWAEFTTTFAAPADCMVIMLYLQTPAGAGELCYWDDISITGLQSIDGAYPNSGVTLGEPGIFGKTSAALSSGSAMLGSNLFATKVDTAEGSAIAWGKVDAAGRWTDLAELRYLFHLKTYADPNKYIVFGKNTQNHQLMWRRKAGFGLSANELTYTFNPTGTTGWFCMGYSWSISTPRLKGYLYAPGVVAWHQVFSDAGANMDDYGTDTMSGIAAALGAGAYPTGQDWIGWASYAACWGGLTLSEAEMQKVMGA
jgi:hypothetical protein